MDMNLQKRLGISIPIIQAPMAGVQGSALAIAVSNAGGLGSLPTAMFGADALRAELKSLRAGTNRPFNVNCFCHAPPVPDAAREAAWRGGLAPYYREFAIDPDSIPEGGGAPAVRCRNGRPAERVRAAGRQLPFRPAVGRSGRSREGVGRHCAVVGDHRGRGALARGSRRRCGDRTRRRGWRPPRHVSEQRHHHAGRHVRACCRRSCGR